MQILSALNRRQWLAFGTIYPALYALCYWLTVACPGYFSQSCLGAVDNGPMVILALCAFDPEGPIMRWAERLARYECLSWLKSPVFLAALVSAVLNTGTDGAGALADPTSCFVGVVFGCSIMIFILPLIYKLRTKKASA